MMSPTTTIALRRPLSDDIFALSRFFNNARFRQLRGEHDRFFPGTMRQDESSSRRAVTLSASSKNPIKSSNYLIQQEFQVIWTKRRIKGLKTHGVV
jgi:hypothetical protein